MAPRSEPLRATSATPAPARASAVALPNPLLAP